MKQFIINMQASQDRHFALIEERLAKGTSGPSKDTLSGVDLPKCTAKNPLAIREPNDHGRRHTAHWGGSRL